MSDEGVEISPSRTRSSTLTWVLGAITAILAAAVTGTVVFVVMSMNDDAPSAQAPATATVVETATPPPPPPTTTPEPVVAEPAAGSTPIEGGACLEGESRNFGTSASGQSLVCTYMGAGGGFRWVRHASNDGSVHHLGEPCDRAVDQVSQDPSGRAIMCGGDTWVDGP